MHEAALRADKIRRACIGFVPDEWDLMSVAEIVERKPNAIVGGPFGSDLVSTDYVPSGIPVIRGTNMSAAIVSGDFVFISHAKGKALEANMAVPGDIIFTQRGTLGQVALVPDAPYEKYLISQSQMKLSANGDFVHKPYLLHYFASFAGQKQILDSAIQTGVPHTNLGILRNYVLPLPPMAEQEAIAEALSDADALIEGLERLIAKKRLIKQGAMQDLLTAKRRLPGFSGEWVKTTLRKLLKSAPSYGINSAACPLGSGGYDYLRITDINEHGQLRQEGRAEVLHPAAVHYFLQPDEIVVARTGASTGKAHRYVGPAERTVFAGFLIKLTPAADEVASSYLFQFMQTDAYWSWVAENSARSGQPGINGQQLSGMTLVLPQDIGEQEAIADVLADMDAEIQALETRLEKARAVKEGMMQNLLTGRIRLV
ncbi:hypothetical protein FBT96_13165 [Rhodobacter capsulatus]|uniref:Type I restriction modification DNA specificity domain-containing protein n=1 Tax=Rhodobacter capsulatus TaxID=1061 RepID=A0A4U1JP01_RHOCA|nr:restriction endonuclease subunit S [Rhodobacter capsulatus]TKD17657.1 hypothetical protein FBT96_13165 [Rhodobacter capsulatus]